MNAPKYVVVAGGDGDPETITGVFETRDDANKWAQDNCAGRQTYSVDIVWPVKSPPRRAAAAKA